MKKIRKADTEWMPFNLSTAERKAAHKWLVKQEKGIVPKPLNNLTLNRYFKIVREAMLALCDDDGNYRDWGGFSGSRNYKKMTPLQTAKVCMDGRSLFHSDYGDVCGLLGNIDPKDPVKFKWWVCNARWGGHPWETKFGDFVPYPIKIKGQKSHYRGTPFLDIDEDLSQYYTDQWLLFFSTSHRCTPFALRSFIRLREQELPVIWSYSDYDVKVLTKRYIADPSNEPDWLSGEWG
ncbi:MAG: hypothetical protein FWF29_11015 [Treponema sp.]|nr:hypothetical protein [Treponema sp.]